LLTASQPTALLGQKFIFGFAASQTDHNEKELQLVIILIATRRHNTPPKLVCLICNKTKQK
jgi:hypothetical protein